MLGQATAAGTGFSRPVRPVRARQAETPRDKARRKLQSRIGSDAAFLFDGDGRERAFRVGDCLFRRDEVGKELCIVLDGIVGLYHVVSSADRSVLAYCGSGDLIVPATVGQARSVEARALTDGTLLAFGLAGLCSPGESQQHLGRALIEATCAELAHHTARLRSYLFLPIRARLASFLLEMGEAIGEPAKRGLVVRLHMSREDIANYLGTRTETVCRILTAWKDRELILMESPRVVVVPDSALLQAAAVE